MISIRLMIAICLSSAIQIQAADKQMKSDNYLSLALDDYGSPSKIRDLKNLVDAGQPIENITKDSPSGSSALHYAVDAEDKPLILDLIKKYKIDVNVKNIRGETPLHQASHIGAFKVAETLLRSGASLEEENEFDETPLDIADLLSHSEDVAKLLECWGISDIKEREDAILHLKDMRKQKKQKALQLIATLQGRAPVATIQTLVTNSAQVEGVKQYSSCEQSALHLAIENRFDRSVISYLIIECKANVNDRDEFGRSSCHLAAIFNDNNALKLLTDHNANINACDSHQNTPLHEACHHGSLKVAETLLQCGADRERKNYLGQTPLKVALAYNHQPIIKMFYV